jgi:hypothetical protein
MSDDKNPLKPHSDEELWIRRKEAEDRAKEKAGENNGEKDGKKEGEKDGKKDGPCGEGCAHSCEPKTPPQWTPLHAPLPSEKSPMNEHEGVSVGTIVVVALIILFGVFVVSMLSR